MRRLVVSGLLAHRLRLALSGLAVVLGVAFVAGTLVFTDTLARTFDELIESTAADVNVEPARVLEAQGPGAGSPLLLEAAVVDRVAGVDGVADASGWLMSEGVYVIGPDGKVVATGGAPGLGIGWQDSDLSGTTLAEGRAPRGPGEVLLDTATARTTGYGPGDTIEVLTPGPRLEVEVVGLLRFGQDGGLAGASMVAFDMATAQEHMTGGAEAFHGVAVAVADGSSDEAVADRVEAALGDGYTVSTREEQVETASQALEDQLAFVDVFLLVFAGVALFVGSFIILNTFSMLVAQRTRQLALLRALGAGRGQVTRSVLAEALVLGVVGSTVGLALGYGVAAGLRTAFGALGLTLDGALVLRPTTVAVSYAVGVLVTLLAAWRPARRAAKVPPVAALRDDQAMPEKGLRVRAWLGATALAAGAGATGTGVAVGEDGGPALVGLGALGLVAGAVALSPVLARPFVRGAGVLLPRLAGRPGALARDNALRNPRRTAATASALMVGAMLVSAFSIVGASANASIGSTVDESMRMDFIVSTSVGQPFSPEVAEQMAGVEGVDRVGVSRLGYAEVDGEAQTFFAADAVTTDMVLELTPVEGRVKRLAGTGFIADEATAEDRGWSVGDRVAVRGATGDEVDLELVGTYAANPAVGPVVLPLPTVTALGGEELDRWVFLTVDEGADPAAVREAADEVVAEYPVVAVKDLDEFTAEQQAQVGQILMIINAMLVLSVLIAVLGIVNTLALSVMERTREVGLLRAVGMSRRQLRTAVRLEAVLIALFGAALGLVIGTSAGVALVEVLGSMGISETSVPVPRLALLVVLAAVVGVLAAVWPARRAARMPVLQAIATA